MEQEEKKQVPVKKKDLKIYIPEDPAEANICDGCE